MNTANMLSGQQRSLLLLALVLLNVQMEAYARFSSSGLEDGSELWGYFDVRPGAHMFWWFYRSPYRSKQGWPLVLWLQGGPGASGVGLGNFFEVGPLNEQLLPRKETWLRKADLLFVDSPVGTGFSYVDNTSLIPTEDRNVAQDLKVMLQELLIAAPELHGSNLYIVGESYGGKHACLLGLTLSKSIGEEKLKINLGGVALGDSWISPLDYVFSWGPLLRSLSRVDQIQENVILKEAKLIKTLLNQEKYINATLAWSDLEILVLELSSNVDFYNVLLDATEDNIPSQATLTSLSRRYLSHFRRYYKKILLKSPAPATSDLTSTMNGPVRQKLKIIPESVKWAESSDAVFDALRGVFMKDVVKEVDELLSVGVNVTVYNGQVDLICATLGTEAWIQKLKWPQLKDFNNESRRTIMSCNNPNVTAAFTKSYRNLSFYWILLAGHMVPVDQPCTALEIIGRITN